MGKERIAANAVGRVERAIIKEKKTFSIWRRELGKKERRYALILSMRNITISSFAHYGERKRGEKKRALTYFDQDSQRGEREVKPHREIDLHLHFNPERSVRKEEGDVLLRVKRWYTREGLHLDRGEKKRKGKVTLISEKKKERSF